MELFDLKIKQNCILPYLHRNLIATVFFPQINDIVAWFVIKFDKLRSTYEWNMKNAALVPHLIVI